MPECDRLTYATDRKLVEHCVKEMTRVYRRHIAKGLRIYVNNRLTQAVDPTYAMANARHTSIEGLNVISNSTILEKAPLIFPGKNGRPFPPPFERILRSASRERRRASLLQRCNVERGCSVLYRRQTDLVPWGLAARGKSKGQPLYVQ